MKNYFKDKEIKGWDRRMMDFLLDYTGLSFGLNAKSKLFIPDVILNNSL